MKTNSNSNSNSNSNVKRGNKIVKIIVKKENPMRKYTNQMDYSLKTASERIELLNSILCDDNGHSVKFFEDMFDQDERESTNKSKSHKEDKRKFVSLLPTCSNALSEDIYECKQIERMADYILKAEDQPRMDKQQEYNFYNKTEFDRLLKKEDLYQEKLDSMNKNGDDFDEGSALAYLGGLASYPGKVHFSKKRVLKARYIDDETKMAYLERVGDNYNLDDSVKITKRDLKDPELLYVKECDDQIKRISGRLKYKRNDKQRWIYTGMIRSLKDAQLEYKKYKKGTISFKQPLRGSTVTDYDEIDMFQKSHVLALLNMSPRKITAEDDLSLILYDLELILKDITVREEDFEIVEMYRKGFSQDDIVEELGVAQQNVNQVLSKLANSVMCEYEDKYEDWYYLDRVKGKYKTCSKCGEVKLTSKFRKESKVNDGLRNSCKKCDIR